MDDDDRYRLDREILEGAVPSTPQRQPDAPTPGDPTAAEKAELVLRALGGAALQPPFGMDTADAVTLWAAQLAPFPIEVLMEVVMEWTEAPGHDFPSIGDITTMARRNVQRAEDARRSQALPPGEHCPRCEGAGYEDGPRDHHGNTTVRPCGLCRRERRAAHDAGCDMPHHVNAGGCERCNPSGRRVRARAA